MKTTTRIALFAALYFVLFLGAMAMITNGVMDIAAAASAPVILSAEAMVLGMIYMTTFHGEAEEDAGHSNAFHGSKLEYSNLTRHMEEKSR